MQMEPGDPAASTSSAKRKSPCANMPIFRSPLSRMFLSPRMHLSPVMRSPSMRRGISPSATLERLLSPSARSLSPVVARTVTSHDLGQGRRVLGDIDFNVPSSSGGQRAIGDFDLNVEPTEELMIAAGSPVANENAPDAQENAHRYDVSNDKRRVIFEALLARANNGNLKGHETREVSVAFSVPVRTVQRIWKQGKRCMDQGSLVDVSSRKSKCGRKKLEVDVSVLRGLPLQLSCDALLVHEAMAQIND